MYVSPLIPKDRARASLEKLQESLSPGEELIAVFSVFRLKRMIDALAITNSRVMTLGPKMLGGTNIVDDIPASSIRSASLSGGFNAGKVEVVTPEGVVSLGTIPPGKQNDQTERTSADTLLQALVTPDPLTMGIDFRKPELSQEHVEPIEIDEGSAHRGAVLIEQLNELASLHSQGKLTDEEFATAKAAVIVSL
jgi:hypothetical protein